MSIKSRGVDLSSRTARAKLKGRHRPYFANLGADLHLGYRKGARDGVWIVRRYVARGKYRTEVIGVADDDASRPSNGATIFDFAQAHEKGRALVAAAADRARVAESGGPLSVSDAVGEYLTRRLAKEEKRLREAGRTSAAKGMRRDAHSKLRRHVLSDAEIATKNLHDLVADDLSQWRDRVAQTVAEATVRRIVNDLKAALNDAARRYRKRVPPALALEIKAGLATTEAAGSVAREKQILADADIRRILTAAKRIDDDGAWDGDLLRAVAVLAATGARFSQIAQLKVRDVQPTAARLMVPVSAKGRGEKTRTHIAVQVGADILDLLRPAIVGRKGHEPLLLRPRWRQEKVGQWVKTGREAWLSSAELTRPWALILKNGELPAGTIPYALRHSSIVRGLRAGLPVRLVAALHDTSSAMIEKHYAAYIVDAMDDLAAKAVVSLLPSEPTALRIVGQV